MANRTEKISFFTTAEDKEWWKHRYHAAEYDSFSAFIAMQLHQLKQQIIQDERKLEWQKQNQNANQMPSNRFPQKGSKQPTLAPAMRKS